VFSARVGRGRVLCAAAAGARGGPGLGARGRREASYCARRWGVRRKWLLDGCAGRTRRPARRRRERSAGRHGVA